MRSQLSSLTLLLICCLLFPLITSAQSSRKKKYVINGYVGGYRGTPVDIDAVDAIKLTHINYAFVNCIDSMAVLSNLKTDTINFRLLNQLKKVNPNLQILISIGGWTLRDFIATGVPAHKLGIGVAFYGKAVDAAGIENNGLGQAHVRPAVGTPIPSTGQAGGFTKLKESVINQNGYTRYWDKDAQAPYLFNPEKKVFITYDDEKSTKLKAKYVKKHKLAGVFFWEYFNDPKEHLLNVLDRTLN